MDPFFVSVSITRVLVTPVAAHPAGILSHIAVHKRMLLQPCNIIEARPAEYAYELTFVFMTPHVYGDILHLFSTNVAYILDTFTF